jgi:hypothetical protein
MVNNARIVPSDAMIILSDSRQCLNRGMSFRVMQDNIRTVPSDTTVILSDAGECQNSARGCYCHSK